MQSDSHLSELEIYFTKKYNLEIRDLVHDCSLRISELRSSNMRTGNPHFTDCQKSFRLYDCLVAFLNELKLVSNYNSMRIWRRARVDYLRVHRRISLHLLVDRKFSVKGRNTVNQRNKEYRSCLKDARDQEVVELLYCMQKAQVGHLLLPDFIEIFANSLNDKDWINLT